MSRLRIYGAQFVLGLVLALTLWTYVSFTTNPNATRQITTPIRIVGLQPGLTIINNGTGLPEFFSQSTTVTITGPKQDIDQLASNELQATLVLDNLQPGVADVPVTVIGPDFVRVRNRVPSEVTLRLARELTATIPITIVKQGQPPFSFSIGTMTQGAQEAVVRGPEELVKRVVAAMGEIDLQGQTVDLATTLTLDAVDVAGDAVEGVSITPQSVSVRVPIVAQFGVQQVSVVPTLKGQPAPGFAVGRIDWEPKIVEIFTSGIVTSTLATEPVLLDGLSNNVTQTVVLQRLPSVITRPQTVAVTVSVEIVPISVPSQLPLLVPVSPTNLGEGLTAPAAEPASVQVTLAGPFEQLSQLANTPGAVAATVDLRDLGPGTYNLPVQIRVPAGLQLISPAAPTVSVTIYPPPTPTPSPTAGATAGPIETVP